MGRRNESPGGTHDGREFERGRVPDDERGSMGRGGRVRSRLGRRCAVDQAGRIRIRLHSHVPPNDFAGHFSRYRPISRLGNHLHRQRQKDAHGGNHTCD
jgi:hypothetical protein